MCGTHSREREQVRQGVEFVVIAMCVWGGGGGADVAEAVDEYP